MIVEYAILFFGFSIVLAVLTVGIAFWLSTAENPRPLRNRSMIAAGSSAATLVMVPLVVVAIEAFFPELIVVAATLIATGMFFAAVVGYPVAFFAGRRFDAKRYGGSADK